MSEPAPVVGSILDDLDGLLVFAWFEVNDGVPQFHSIGLAETQLGRHDLFYRALDPFGEDAELIGEYSTLAEHPDGIGALLHGLILLNNRRAAHGGRRPFDCLPLLVVSNNAMAAQDLVGFWREVGQFKSEDLFRRLRQYDAFGPLWHVGQEPPRDAEAPAPERMMRQARTPRARREAHALAIVHWWNRSRTRPQRVATLVAFSGAWEQAERGGAKIGRSELYSYLQRYGLPIQSIPVC